MYLIKTVKGDITKITDVQAIVNAANNSLLGGGGLVKAVQFLSQYVQGRLSAPGEASNNHSLL